MCCSKPTRHEMMQTQMNEWWHFVKIPNATRTFGTLEAAEHFLAQDISTLSERDAAFYAQLVYQKEMAES